MDESTQPPKRAHVSYRPTTASQRQYLFELVESLGNVTEAARLAHVSRGTYYKWLPRYRAEGVAGLAQERSRAPHRTRIPPVSEALKAEVLAYQRDHPGEGYRQIAAGVNKAHTWEKVISHTKVGEILHAAGRVRVLPPAPAEAPGGAFSPRDGNDPRAPAGRDAQH